MDETTGLGVEAEPIAGRNVGCCGLAGATWGRLHYPVCVNHRDAR